jgi:GNAT superfamily N-acetyltransferase
MSMNTPATPTKPTRGWAVQAAQRGSWVPVRTLSARHREQVVAHLMALDDTDRRRRFGHRASDDSINHYVEQMNFERDEVFGTFDRSLTLVALGHLALDPGGGTGEFGVSVHPRARGRRLGSQLFAHAVTHARNRQVHTLYIHLARENAAMLAIVQRAGAAVSFEGSDAIAQLALPADTLGSQLHELLDHQAAEFDYRLKMQALRVDTLLPPRS